MSLLPPISITNVLTVPQWEVELAGLFDSNYGINNIQKDADKFFAVEAWLRLTHVSGELSGELVHPVEAGDIIVVTYDKDDLPPSSYDAELGCYPLSTYQTWKNDMMDTDDGERFYNIDPTLIGPYIVTSPSYNPYTDKVITEKLEPQVQKLAFPEAGILSINNVPADDQGMVALHLSDLYREDSKVEVGKELANAICSIVPSSVLYGSRLELYQYAEGTEGGKICIPYAKFSDITELSGIIGNINDEAPSGEYELILSKSVLSQLRRIYGDLTNISTNISTLSGTVGELSGAFDKFKITLEEDNVAGLQWFDTDWKTIISGTFIPDEVFYNSVQVTEQDINDNTLMGAIDGQGGYYAKYLFKNQYVHTIKVEGDFQIIACYSGEETSSKAKLVYPDVVYTPSANYISVLSENENVPGIPWKIFITKNIHIGV